MATLPKFVRNPLLYFDENGPTDDASRQALLLKYAYKGGVYPIIGQNIDLSRVTLPIIGRDTVSNPNVDVCASIKLSDLINYIVDTAKGQ
jgi:hypothetical protein